MNPRSLDVYRSTGGGNRESVLSATCLDSKTRPWRRSATGCSCGPHANRTLKTGWALPSEQALEPGLWGERRRGRASAQRLACPGRAANGRWTRVSALHNSDAAIGLRAVVFQPARQCSDMEFKAMIVGIEEVE